MEDVDIKLGVFSILTSTNICTTPPGETSLVVQGANKMESAADQPKQEGRRDNDLERRIKRHLLSLCDLGLEKPAGRPTLPALKARIRRAYQGEEAKLLTGHVKRYGRDEAGFWADMRAFERAERGKGIVGVEGKLGLDKTEGWFVRLLARAEAAEHVRVRMALKEVKEVFKGGEDVVGGGRGGRAAEVLDFTGHAERALEMAECLPQGRFLRVVRVGG